ncbi:MAG: hypothetical protein E6I21_00200 [Chloroflexi bacterium]|nr:MAG: hypothetical protein E6I21_00200 [Chloroflexota bacterium]
MGAREDERPRARICPRGSDSALARRAPLVEASPGNVGAQTRPDLKARA